MMAHLALKYGETRDVQPSIISDRQDISGLNLNVTGLKRRPTIRYQFHQWIQPRSPTLEHQSLSWTRCSSKSTRILLPILYPKYHHRSEFKYIIKLSNGPYIFRDTVTKYFGPKLVVFQDSCNSLQNGLPRNGIFPTLHIIPRPGPSLILPRGTTATIQMFLSLPG